MAANYDPTDLRGRDQDKRELDARKRMVRETEIADVKWLMSSPRGRRFIWRLLDNERPFKSSFDPNAMKMSLNEGMRIRAVELFSEVMAICPGLYEVMAKEQKDGRDGNGDQFN
ncbi:MAG TPA: hypothetical protein VGR47_05980 [Terracidiphilus sp.]|nr:hypothetical protein [Terracidiphilus sp.]